MSNDLSMSNLVLEALSEEKKKKLKKFALAGGLAALGAGAAGYGYKKYKDYNSFGNRFKRGAIKAGHAAAEHAKTAGSAIARGAKAAGGVVAKGAKTVGAHVKNFYTYPTSRVVNGEIVPGPRKLNKTRVLLTAGAGKLVYDHFKNSSKKQANG